MMLYYDVIKCSQCRQINVSIILMSYDCHIQVELGLWVIYKLWRDELYREGSNCVGVGTLKTTKKT